MRPENPQSFNAGQVGDEISVDAKPDALNQGLMRNTTSKKPMRALSIFFGNQCAATGPVIERQLAHAERNAVSTPYNFRE